MHSDETTDIDILYSNLRHCTNNDNENVVLIKTGALNPIHRSHISNLVQTKQYLEQIHHFNVLGGYISPTHDDYVHGKLHDEQIPAKHRIEMCQKAIEEAKEQHWLRVDKAECMAHKFVRFSNVACSLQNFINDKLKLPRYVRVIYVSGLDLFNRCGGIRQLRKSNMGVAVVYRPGEHENLVKTNDPNLFYVPIDDEAKLAIQDVSSTKIRHNLKNNVPCDQLTYTSVLDYLKMIPISSQKRHS
ncbi:unnamed protein product [Didymodactylos carnosus]|uniref:Cytidyltransferase-like domain-containing protein n=1 Tax=Didymodactylos carnosus TaxID=1234261 RepID=A0A814WKM7_9BILA|nr:unnamed protein product [Didymodactylos carnosus]CAF1205291.1 unnamed protein product [Didymodactylos carnosus]CAF3672446.1 unnamed protein product [Didymodactylos carnosus]CAF3969563.1 unnamed protein product [Didymodactylos carnosus]